MLSLVPPPDYAEARTLLLVSSWQWQWRWVALLLALPTGGMVLLAAGLHWGGLLVGTSVALTLSRYGPTWWPGRR